MIKLTERQSGTEFRVAAHCISHYYRDAGDDFTRVCGHGGWDVRETVEEIDQWFLVVPFEDWTPIKVDAVEDEDGAIRT